MYKDYSENNQLLSGGNRQNIHETSSLADHIKSSTNCQRVSRLHLSERVDTAAATTGLQTMYLQTRGASGLSQTHWLSADDCETLSITTTNYTQSCVMNINKGKYHGHKQTKRWGGGQIQCLLKQ